MKLKSENRRSIKKILEQYITLLELGKILPGSHAPTKQDLDKPLDVTNDSKHPFGYI